MFTDGRSRVHRWKLVLAVFRHVVAHHSHVTTRQAGGVAVIFAVQLPRGDVVVGRHVDLMSVRELQMQISGIIPRDIGASRSGKSSLDKRQKNGGRGFSGRVWRRSTLVWTLGSR